ARARGRRRRDERAREVRAGLEAVDRADVDPPRRVVHAVDLEAGAPVVVVERPVRRVREGRGTAWREAGGIVLPGVAEAGADRVVVALALVDREVDRLVLAVLRLVHQHLRRRVLAVRGRRGDRGVAAGDERRRDAVEGQVLIVAVAEHIVRTAIDEVERHGVRARRTLVLIRVGLVAHAVI